MKTKNVFVVEVLAMVLAFGFGLADCASTGGSGTSAASDKETKRLASELAGNLNAIKAGSGASEDALAEGAKVTLSGEVRLTTGLDVPQGVTLVVPEGGTLDLTTEGARLVLKDGAVLTVDGTVNASGHGDHGNGWVEGGLHVGDGETVINGSGTINLKSKGRLLNIGSDRSKRHLTLDGVTLVGIEDNDESLVGVNEGGELVLKSGAITGNTRLGEGWTGGGGVSVHRGVFRMEGGTISDNSAVSSKEGSSGGGVEVGERSVFTMKGGMITGNTAGAGGERQEAQGGGVRVYKGTFTMEDGVISGNNATGRWIGDGGGVCIQESVFTMKCGAISDNSAHGERTSRGGGVRFAASGTFTMEGGIISGNSAGDGGGVMAQVSKPGKITFTMNDGAITGNSAGQGGGVCLHNSCTFNMEGGAISGNSG